MRSTLWLRPRDRRLWCLGALIIWGRLASLALAADVVPPRPLPHTPTGGTLAIAYMRETSSPDGFQAVGTFDRMYFFTGNEVLVAIGKDGLYDPAESLAYAYDVLDEGKRYRFHLRQGVEFQGGLGEMTAADAGFRGKRNHRHPPLPAGTHYLHRETARGITPYYPGRRRPAAPGPPTH